MKKNIIVISLFFVFIVFVLLAVFLVRIIWEEWNDHIDVIENTAQDDHEYMIITDQDINIVESYFSWTQDSSNIVTWDLENIISEEDYAKRRLELDILITWIVYPKECIENVSFFNNLPELNYCIEEKEDEYLRNINEYTNSHCDRFVYRKEECYDYLYFDESLELLDKEKCENIVNEFRKQYCINLVTEYQKEEIIEEKIKECDFQNKTNLSVKCVSKMAVERNDMRICKQYLEWKDVVKCENNISNVVIQNVLLEVMETWDKSKCDSITIEDYKNSCISI